MNELVILSDGEYSDFQVRCLVKTLTDRTFNEMRNEYLRENQEETRPYRANFDEFIAWLLSQGYVDTVDYKEMHLGSYGSFNNNLEYF